MLGMPFWEAQNLDGTWHRTYQPQSVLSVDGLTGDPMVLLDHDKVGAFSAHVTLMQQRRALLEEVACKPLADLSKVETPPTPPMTDD